MKWIAKGLLITMMLLSGCTSAPPPDAFREHRERMELEGGVYALTLWMPAWESGRAASGGRGTSGLAVQLLERAWARFLAVHQCADAVNPDGELARLLATARGKAMPVSEDLFALLKRTLETDLLAPGNGVFGTRRPRLFPASGTVMFPGDAQAPDLGVVAAGQALDEMVGLLERAGSPHVLAEGPGLWRAGSVPPGKPGWLIRPFSGHAPVLLPAHRALAVRECDPGGEFPPTRCWVVAASAAEANAVAAAMCKTEPGMVRGWIRTPTGVEARFEIPGETGELEIHETPGFSALLRARE